jgi:hypothetical protein
MGRCRHFGREAKGLGLSNFRTARIIFTGLGTAPITCEFPEGVMPYFRI